MKPLLIILALLVPLGGIAKYSYDKNQCDLDMQCRADVANKQAKYDAEHAIELAKVERQVREYGEQQAAAEYAKTHPQVTVNMLWVQQTDVLVVRK